jgi:hypothetical protein
MSEFFPIPDPLKLNPHVELEVFQCQDTIFQLYVIAPNAKLESHQHPESQIGMVFSAELELYIKDLIKPLRPLQDVYIADGNIPHGAFNPLSSFIYICYCIYIFITISYFFCNFPYFYISYPDNIPTAVLMAFYLLYYIDIYKYIFLYIYIAFYFYLVYISIVAVESNKQIKTRSWE